MKRQFDPASPELMDLPQPVTPELDRDLANLRSLNRWFGSYRLVRHFLRRWLKPRASVRIVDLATGSGDIPRAIVRFARLRNIIVDIEAVDQQSATIQIARQLSHDFPEIHFACADLFEWNPPQPCDIVLCSLALHHFSDEDAVRVLRKCREISGGRVLVADLRRSRWLSLAIYILTAFFFREEMTRTDARLSAARAFSFREFRQLAERAGWVGFRHRRFAVGRQAIWVSIAPLQ